MNDSILARGQTWQEYLASMTMNRTLLERKVAEFRLETPSPFLHSPIRTVLAFTEDWCQDAVTAFPPLIGIVEVANLTLSVMRRSGELALHQSLTGAEYPPVPTFVFLDEKGQSYGQFLEMPRAFRRALQDPAEAMWLREQYDELWWEAEIEEIAAIFQRTSPL